MKNAATTRRNRLVGLLHELEKRLPLAAVKELIRLISSPHFSALTPRQVRSVGDYDCIEIEGARYFERAFAPGKEAASTLVLAQLIGRNRVLDDLRRLHASAAAANAA